MLSGVGQGAAAGTRQRQWGHPLRSSGCAFHAPMQQVAIEAAVGTPTPASPLCQLSSLVRACVGGVSTRQAASSFRVQCQCMTSLSNRTVNEAAPAKPSNTPCLCCEGVRRRWAAPTVPHPPSPPLPGLPGHRCPAGRHLDRGHAPRTEGSTSRWCWRRGHSRVASPAKVSRPPSQQAGARPSGGKAPWLAAVRCEWFGAARRPPPARAIKPDALSQTRWHALHCNPRYAPA